MIDFIFNFLIQFDLLIKNNFELSIIVYFIFAFLFFAFSIPGNLFIILTSSFYFGFVIGFFVNIVAIVSGSLCFFLLFKYIFKKYSIKYLDKFGSKLNRIVRKSSFEYLILLRLIFGIPLFLQNIFLSTLEISKTKFLITSFLGFTPHFLFFSFVGNGFSNLLQIKSIETINLFSIEFVLLIIILIIFLLFRIFFKFK
tara:strand:+ start:133 stop:726 length:594 start_codon:yes stop_codon:yes gene_type:complete